MHTNAGTVSPVDSRVYPIINFVIKPYLQLGDNAIPNAEPELTLVWHAATSKDAWQVELKVEGDWVKCEPAQRTTINISGVVPHRRYKVILANLHAGKEFCYRLLWKGSVVFQSTAKAPISKGRSCRTALVGDLEESAAVAHLLHSLDPDLTVLLGDLVYNHGRFSEYLEDFFPCFNADQDDPAIGAPLMRSRLVTADIGNHDVSVPKKVRGNAGTKTGKKHLDVFAYRLLWEHPDNGPVGSLKKSTIADADEGKYKLSLAIAKSGTLRKTNFAYYFGNCFWLHLDGNPYVDWNSPKLRRWVCNRLTEASDAAWKFVVIHQPAFTCDVAYRTQQRSRLLCEIFQACGVDIVFSGHAHMFERSYPLTFSLVAQPDGRPISEDGVVKGNIVLDKEFDGKSVRKPKGVIYVTSGAGGKGLSPDHRPDLTVLPEYLRTVELDNRSVTVVETEEKTLTLRQVSTSGNILDEITIEK